mmetsp:Transcript_30693/g.42896  ORF Transcript_30693/g.42896 Transcript_30693/m.42896 type:complete len:138 (-) Transcript_30693:292-705(-)
MIHSSSYWYCYSCHDAVPILHRHCSCGSSRSSDSSSTIERKHNEATSENVRVLLKTSLKFPDHPDFVHESIFEHVERELPFNIKQKQFPAPRRSTLKQKQKNRKAHSKKKKSKKRSERVAEKHNSTKSQQTKRKTRK